MALRKLRMGTMPDVEGELASFEGMPSTCRKSILAPLDKIKELGLQWVLTPKLDSRGCIQVSSGPDGPRSARRPGFRPAVVAGGPDPTPGREISAGGGMPLLCAVARAELEPCHQQAIAAQGSDRRDL